VVLVVLVGAVVEAAAVLQIHVLHQVLAVLAAQVAFAFMFGKDYT
jgi:hypothetical protein